MRRETLADGGLVQKDTIALVGENFPTTWLPRGHSLLREHDMSFKASDLSVCITVGRRRFVERIRILPRVLREVVITIAGRPTRSRRWLWLRVRAAWLIGGIQFRIDGRPFEVIGYD